MPKPQRDITYSHAFVAYGATYKTQVFVHGLGNGACRSGKESYFEAVGRLTSLSRSAKH